MRKLLFFGLLLLSPSLFAQHEIDSIGLKFSELEDSLRIQALNALAYQVMFSKPQLAELYANQSVMLSESSGFPGGIAKGHNLIGMSHDLRGNYELAVAAYEKGLKVLDDTENKSGQTYMALCNGLGLAYSRKGDYPRALDFFLIALKLAEQKDNKTVLLNVLLNIGTVYYDQKNFDMALDFYSKCKDHAEKYDEMAMLAKAMTNIGLVYWAQKQYDEAVRYLLVSLEEKRKTDDILAVSTSLTNLAGIHKDIGDYEIALGYLDRAEQLKRRVGDTWGLVEVNDIRASIYLEENNVIQAELLLKTNLRLANEINSTNKGMVYQRLHDLYKKKNDYKNALKWYVRSTAYNDSVFNETKSKQLAELQTLYEVNKKENRIIKLEKESEAERFAKNLTVVLLVSVFFLAVCVIAFFRFRAAKRQQLFKIELELQQKRLENASLREEELQKEIAFKNKELASYTINFVQKSELMEELKRNLSDIRTQDPILNKKLKAIQRLVENTYQVNKEWEDFRLKFENVHIDFFKSIKERFPDLTNGDLKLCALLKLNMNMKEAAKVLGISPESVKTARYRLRKKFGLAQEDNLVDFILTVEDEVTPEESIVTLQNTANAKAQQLISKSNGFHSFASG